MNRIIVAIISVFFLAGISFAVDVGSCPYKINASGTYDLITNLVVGGISDQGCIIVNAPNVTINFAGKSIENNTGTGFAYGIYLNHSLENISIIDGNMSNLYEAIYIENNYNVSIRNITFTNISNYAIESGFASFLDSNISVNITVENVRIFNSSHGSDTYAPILFRGLNHSVKNSVIHNNSNGIEISGKYVNISNVSLMQNTFRSVRASGSGYCVGTSFANVTGGPYNRSILYVVENATLIENYTLSQLIICDSGNFTVSNVTIDNYPHHSDGFVVLSGSIGDTGDSVLRNVVVNGTHAGIILYKGPFNLTNVTSINNRPFGVSPDGVDIQTSLTGAYNTLINVTAMNNSGAGLDLTTGEYRIYNSTFINNSEDGISGDGVMIYNSTLENVNASANNWTGVNFAALSMMGATPTSHVLLSNVTAINNLRFGVVFAGAIGFGSNVIADNYTLQNSYLSDNSAGDVLAHMLENLSIVNTTFNSSASQLVGSFYPAYLNYSVNVTINNSIFVNSGNAILFNFTNKSYIQATTFKSTNISLDSYESNYSVVSDATLPVAAPDSYTSLSRMVNVTNHTGSPNFNLTVFYEASDLTGLDESSVSLFVVPIETSSWSYVSSQTLDSTSNLVRRADTAVYGTHALFANTSTSSSSSSTSTGDSDSEDPLLSVEYSLDGNTVTITVEGKGAPLSDATVSLIQYDPFVGEIAELQTDDEGQVTFVLETSADYLVRAAKSGYRSRSVEFTYDTEEPLPPELPELSIDSSFDCEAQEFSVLVTSEGQPVPGAAITLLVGQNIIAEGVTDADGKVTFEALQPDEVHASKEGYEEETDQVAIVECGSEEPPQEIPGEEECESFSVTPAANAVAGSLVAFSVTCDGEAVAQGQLVLVQGDMTKYAAITNGQAFVRFEQDGTYALQVQSPTGLVAAGTVDVAPRASAPQETPATPEAPAQEQNSMPLILGALLVLALVGGGIYVLYTGVIKL